MPWARRCRITPRVGLLFVYHSNSRRRIAVPGSPQEAWSRARAGHLLFSLAVAIVKVEASVVIGDTFADILFHLCPLRRVAVRVSDVVGTAAVQELSAGSITETCCSDSVCGLVVRRPDRFASASRP